MTVPEVQVRQAQVADALPLFGPRRFFVVCLLLAHCDSASPGGEAPSSTSSGPQAPEPPASSIGLPGNLADTVEATLTVPDFTAARSEQLDASMMDFLSDYQSINATGWHDGPGRRRGWAYGAYLDGELGSHVRIGTLIDEIDMHGPTAASLDGPWQLGQYPARDALMKLGYWSVRHMSDRIGAELDPARRAMMVEVVMKVLGTKMTRWYLRGIIRDPVTRGELDRSLAALGATEMPPELFEPPSVVGSEHDSYTFRIPDLDSLASTGTYAAVLQLLATHRQLRADLAARLANGKPSDAGRTYLIYILGEMRAAEAVEPLLDVIDFKTHPDGKGTHARWDQRPAEQALYWLGFTSVRAIMKRLPTERVELRRRLMCGVLHELLGRGVTRAMLDDALLNEPDRKRQEGWREAIRTQEKTP